MFDEELVVSRKVDVVHILKAHQNINIPCSINIWWTEHSFSCAETPGSFLFRNICSHHVPIHDFPAMLFGIDSSR